MHLLILLVCSLHVLVSHATITDSTTSKHNPNIPQYFYSTVTSFDIRTNVMPNSLAHRRLNIEEAPYGSHVELSFGIEGMMLRNYSNVVLELNNELFDDDYRVTIDGEKWLSASKRTAYQADLPNESGWIRLTLVPNHPELFHAFVFHSAGDENNDGGADLIVVEPLENSELARTSSEHDHNPTHRCLRENLLHKDRRATMVAYSHGQHVHPSVKSDGESSWLKTRRLLESMSHKMTKKRKRRNLSNTMGKPLRDSISTYLGPYGTASGCPVTMQKLRMGLAVDAGFYVGVGGSTSPSAGDKVAAYINNMMNLANVIYVDQFNVFLAIGEYVMYSRTSSSPNWSGGTWNQSPQGMTSSGGVGTPWGSTARGDSGCYISRYEKAHHNGIVRNPSQDSDRVCCGYTSGGSGADTDYGRLLSRFKDWQNDDMSAQTSGRGDTYGLWHLFTNCFPPAGTVGLAYLGTTCRSYSTGWSTLTGGTWETFTHEVGHNFGASHTMNDGGIMSYDDGPEFKFTGSNPNDVCTHIADSRSQTSGTRVAGDQCFTNFVSGSCGNFIMEPGEDCDGGVCCTSSCTLKTTAHCNYKTYYLSEDGQTIGELVNECCTNQCKPSGTNLCDSGNGFCRNGACEATPNGISSTKTNSKTSNWCYYGNFEMCDVSNLGAADSCKVRCNPVDTNLGCKSLDSLQANFGTNFNQWVNKFKDGDVCKTDASGLYKVCSNGNCVDGVDPKAGSGGGDPPVDETITVDTPLSLWTGGSTATVTWSSSSGILSSEIVVVTLRRSGVDVATLATTENDGTQVVTPALSTTAASDYLVCVARQSGPSALEGCSSMFTIESAPRITSVTLSPLDNGGGVSTGSQYNILWQTTGTMSNVRIQLRKGTSQSNMLVSTIASNTANDLTHQWVVDGSLAIDDGYFLRVANKADTSSFQDSSTFSVHSPSSYTIVMPHAHTDWVRGGSATITWSSTGSPTFLGGAVLISVGQEGAIIGSFQPHPNDGSLTMGTVSTEWGLNTNYWVRISDVATGAVIFTTPTFAVVDAPPDPSIQASAPTECTAGSQCIITWTSIGAVSSTVTLKRIEGATTTTITTGIDNGDGTYSWSIPTNQGASTSYFKVEDSNGISDVTDAVAILVAPDLAVIGISPNVEWIRGNSATVQWSSVGVVGPVTIKIRSSSSGKLTNVVSNTANDGSYVIQGSVTTALEIASGYTVILTSGSLSTSSSPFAAVDPNSISLSGPPSGCVVGGTCSIAWTTTGSVSAVRVTYSGNGMAGTIVSSISSREYTWAVPSIPPGSGYSIRIEMSSNSNVFDVSESFSIDYPATLTLNAPTSVSQWIVGSSASVAWSSLGSASSGFITITLQHGTRSDVNLATNTANDGSFTVTTQQTTDIVPDSGYTVKVQHTGGTTVTSDSFTVYVPRAVDVDTSSPTKCIIGSLCSLVFTKQGLVTNVKITYYKGTTNGVVVASTSSSPYSWTVPNSLEAGAWSVRVEDASGSSVSDVSFVFFSFSFFPFLRSHFLFFSIIFIHSFAPFLLRLFRHEL